MYRVLSSLIYCPMDILNSDWDRRAFRFGPRNLFPSKCCPRMDLSLRPLSNYSNFSIDSKICGVWIKNVDQPFLCSKFGRWTGLVLFSSSIKTIGWLDPFRLESGNFIFPNCKCPNLCSFTLCFDLFLKLWFSKLVGNLFFYTCRRVRYYRVWLYKNVVD